MKKLLGFLLLLLIVAGAAARRACTGASTSRIAATRAPSSSSRSRRARAAVAIGERLVAAGVVRDTPTFRAALWMSRQGRHLKAGEYRFDRADDAVRDHRQDRARRRVRDQRDVSRRADDRRDGEDLRVARARDRRRRSSRRRRDPAPIHELDPAARDLEGYLFPETYALPRHTDAAKLVRMMVARFEKVFTPELRAGGRGARPDRPPGGDAGVDRREGNGEGGGAAAGRRRLHHPAAHRHAAAVRSDGDLRAGEGRPLRRQHPQGRPVVRLAVQHLSLSGPAARADRLARPRVARGRGASGRRRLPVFRQPQRRLARVRAHARGAQPECSEVSGSVLPRSDKRQQGRWAGRQVAARGES